MILQINIDIYVTVDLNFHRALIFADIVFAL